MIEIKNVHKSYGNLNILKGVDMSVEKGEVVSIIGPSGSGKSTLLQCINGLESISDGNICVDGVNVFSRATDLNALRANVGIVFQQYNVFPHLSVLDNAALALKVVRKMKRKSAEEVAYAQLEKVGLGDKASMSPTQLSGGQQQRLAIARALAMQPRYMLFDEVTAALDPQLVREVLDTLLMLSTEGMTMVLVTHEIAFAREVSSRVAFFDAGKIAEIGPPRQVIDSPKNERTQQFLSHQIH
ncbi:glutamine ABC transporter ATP-binding protein [Pseudomonas laurylsulfativorans]|uniref:Glutamine ABC transporter ATP-binding protein n=1 Tax=Pseudomonas laurylsulfativorans TaxID=1943631 RepID=A0A2S3VR86_9PSED|nr:amino acid ABC transporter ATP-binding protein [Pseudomonas laurylsulfativorans]POF42442.1 glutamine ABC transporter ATP-binding protein [Pseudomonas laurylsulfativorans]